LLVPNELFCSGGFAGPVAGPLGSEETAMSVMWFYDDVPEEYRTFRQDAERLEREHLETRKALQKAEAALRSDPEDPALQTAAAELKDKLAELDKRAPWISQGDLLEMLIWGSPH
jgi:hypothetical protein